MNEEAITRPGSGRSPASILPRRSLSQAFGKLHRGLRALAVVGLASLIAWADYVTPPYIFLVGFYLLPIFLAIWYCGYFAVALVLLISTGTSLYMTSLSLPAAEPVWTSGLAYLSVVLVFAGFSALVFGLKVVWIAVSEHRH